MFFSNLLFYLFIETALNLLLNPPFSTPCVRSEARAVCTACHCQLTRYSRAFKFTLSCHHLNFNTL
jgi:hypothetical protein